MAEKQLDLDRIERAMTESGLNAAALASSLDVSKTIVSEWLKGRKFPRPALLLSLGKLLGLKYSELVRQPIILREPVVAYRKHGNSKLKKEDLVRAKGLGRSVGLLVPYLPFNRLDGPSRLIAPSLDASYIENAAAETRRMLGCTDGRIEFEQIIDLYADLKTVLIPVLWGEKGGCAYGLHVYLPESQTTFVYLNLDTKLFDFKFWMLHELGHAKTFDLLNEKDAENFSDSFASAILVPHSLAEAQLAIVASLTDMGARIAHTLELARQLVVSPITIARRIDSIARSRGAKPLIGDAIFPAAANFNREYGLVSSNLFATREPEASDLILASAQIFKSPIYATLRAYIAENGPEEGIVAACLGLGPADAKAVLLALKA